MKQFEMKQFAKTTRFAIFTLLVVQSVVAKGDVIKYIDPTIGTTTTKEYKGRNLGKTIPGSSTPFGLVQLGPDTRTGGDNAAGYMWHHPTIEGFSFIHMSGVGWYGDFGNFLVTPSVGELHSHVGAEDDPQSGYRSKYSHDTEVAKAGYYAVTLDDYDVRVELTSLPHSGILRFTYPESDASHIGIDLARRIGGSASEQYVEVVDDQTIQGWMRCDDTDGGWGNGVGKVNYTVYFYAQFSRPMTEYGVWDATIPEKYPNQKMANHWEPDYVEALVNAQRKPMIESAQGRHIGFYNSFKSQKGDVVLLKAGISFVSIEGAKANLETEIPDWDFENVSAENENLWRDAMNNIAIKGGTEREKRIFYTALYHTMVDPRSTSDLSGEYVAADNSIQRNNSFVYRSIFSGWDVFRSQFPLQTIINPRMVNDEVNSLIEIADRSGKKYYPRWEIMNSYSGCMVGNPAVSVVADAYQCGIREWDIDKGFEYCINSVEHWSNQPRGYNTSSRDGISVTLEYAYSDWCAGDFARRLGKEELSQRHLKRSLDYKNIWCDSVEWFRGRNIDGSWGKWVAETTHGLYCTESNALQQGWFVPHDIYGFIDMLGHKRFTEKLTHFFDSSSEDLLWNDYYNHPNEPVHHVPFMFAYTGNSWLTQKWTRRICDIAYGDDIYGLCGNDDVGQMSAWYILASIGMHPVNPGDGIYILTSPIFDEVTIRLDPDFYDGKQFRMRAKNNSVENCYIQSVKLNGKRLDRAWIRHEEIVGGGELEFVMGPKPNYKFGRKNLPPSYGRERWSVE